MNKTHTIYLKLSFTFKISLLLHNDFIADRKIHFNSKVDKKFAV